MVIQGKIVRKIFFISDAHLGLTRDKTEKEREKHLLSFLKYVEKTATDLFIVGDLFDFWFEYHYVIPRKYFSVLVALKQLTENGVKVGYLTGNHDFWVDSFFEEELNIQVYRNPLDITINGKRLFISHGDGLVKKDTGYRILKKILRYPLNVKLYRLLHPDLGFGLANFFSNLSRNYRKPKDRDSEYIQYARERFAEGFDGVILAHTHRAQELHEDNKTYINIGDWISSFTYGKFEKGRLSLEKWVKVNYK